MRRRTIPPFLIAVPLILGACSNREDAGDAAAPSNAGEPYPLTTCVVSGEDLGSMGEPVVYDHEGTTVKFCCKNCVPKFEKDSETYLAKLKS